MAPTLDVLVLLKTKSIYIFMLYVFRKKSLEVTSFQSALLTKNAVYVSDFQRPLKPTDF